MFLPSLPFQGYINFGTNAAAAVRDAVTAVEDGIYTFRFRYRSTSATINTVDMYVNGIKVGTPEFTQTDNDNTVTHQVQATCILIILSLKDNKNSYNSIIRILQVVSCG